MTRTAKQIQFQQVGATKKGTSRVLWSDDFGITWHEPEDATVEVAKEWQRITKQA